MNLRLFIHDLLILALCWCLWQALGRVAALEARPALPSVVPVNLLKVP